MVRNYFTICGFLFSNVCVCPHLYSCLQYLLQNTSYRLNWQCISSSQITYRMSVLSLILIQSNYLQFLVRGPCVLLSIFRLSSSSLSFFILLFSTITPFTPGYIFWSRCLNLQGVLKWQLWAITKKGCLYNIRFKNQWILTLLPPILFPFILIDLVYFLGIWVRLDWFSN